jgi:hypothetical protein
MKKLLLSLGVILLFFMEGRAQLVANAGPDASICMNLVATLGGSPTASGGTSPYTYSWVGPNGYTANTANPTNVTWGTYTLMVTDNVGAQAFDTIVISPWALPVIFPGNDTICLGDSAILGGSPTASGTVGPYSFAWSGGLPSSSNPVVTPVASTVYTVSVVDGRGCTSSAQAIITVLNCNAFSINHANPTCFGSCNGYAAVSPQGNNKYLWSTGDTTRTIIQLCAGTYSVTVSDAAYNALDTVSVVLTQPSQMFAAATANNVTCFGGQNGMVVLTATGGAPPYTYIWNNGMTGTFANNLPAGTYSVTVVDPNQCTVSAMAVITEPTQLIAATSATGESIANACDGSINLTVSGGTPGYIFNWSNGSTTEDILGLCVGFYTATITDVNGCTVTATDVVSAACPTNTIVLSLSSTGDLDCMHSVDTLTATASGGTPPLTYLWNNSDTSTSIFATQAGVYSIWVTDSVGCVRTASDTVLNLGLVVSIQSATPVACNGVPNGKIKLAVSGGTLPYTFAWSNGATADSIENVASGTYSVTVSDAASCSVTFSYFLNQTNTNWSYYVYVNSTPANCATNGTATATPFGGTGPYTYLWNTTPPQITQTATGLATGYVTVTVTGNDGCTRTGSAYIQTSCYNVVQGYLFHDTNGNCVRDSGEAPIANTSVYASGGGQSFYGYSNANGLYTINVWAAGAFQLNSYMNNGWGCTNASVCPQTVSFSGFGDSAVANIGFGGVPGFNLSIHPGWTSANPGQTKDYWVLYDQSSSPMYNGPAVITFTYDPVLQYQGCTNGCVHNAAAHTVTWNLASVPTSWVNWNSRPIATFLVPVGTSLNYQLHADFIITPTSGDCYVGDNVLSAIEPITGSHDPNEKEVLPAGDIMEEDSILTYTIHFQNTGNDTTWFITVKDTLSPYVNPATVQNIASSHEYSSFNISDNGILTWVFNPIYLVDSTTNAAASKGYVMFRVKKKNNLPLATQIKNKAHIYFDYNEAIVTNTVSNTLTQPNYIFTVKSDRNISVSAMPNPFTQSTQIVVEGINSTFDFELFDVTGKTIKKISSLNGNRFELDRETMSAGVYFYRITSTTMQRGYGRVVVE